MHNKHLYAVSGVLFVAIVATFTYAFNATKSDSPSHLAASQNQPNMMVPEVKMPVSSTAAAQKIAEGRRPGQRVVKVQTLQKDDQLSYQVLFSDGSKVEISAKDGTVVNEADVNEPIHQSASDGTVPVEDTPATDPPTDEQPTQDSEETPSSPSEEPSEEPAV